MPDHRTTSRFRFSRLALVLMLGATLLAADFAEAQMRGRGGGGGGRSGGGAGRPSSVGRTLLNRQNGGFRTGLSGVKAQLPRPIANRGSLLPPQRSGHGHGGGRPSHFIPGTGFNGLNDSSDVFRRSGGGRPRNVGGDGIDARFDSDSGFRLRGNFSDDNSRFRFDLNPGGVGSSNRGRWHGGYGGHGGHGGHHNHHSHFSPAIRYWPYGDLWGLGWGWGWGYNDYDYYPPETITSSPIYIDASLLGTQPQQNQQPATPPPPPTAIEKADYALYNGMVKEAITSYREHLDENPEDADAMRSLAIALVQDRKVKEAVAIMALAYDKDISLVRKRMNPLMVADGEEGFRDVLRSTVLFSNKMKSASGFLAVVVMMQAEGREPQALKILEKAKAAGLDEKLATEFENEMKR